MRQQVAQCVRRGLGRRRVIAAQAPPPVPGSRIDRGQGGPVRVRPAAPAAEGGQRLPALGDGIAAGPQGIAAFDQGRKIAGQRHPLRRLRGQQHRGDPRMGAQGQHAAPLWGNGARGVQRPQPP
jgi:hypothetical protein